MVQAGRRVPSDLQRHGEVASADWSPSQAKPSLSCHLATAGTSPHLEHAHNGGGVEVILPRVVGLP